MSGCGLRSSFQEKELSKAATSSALSIEMISSATGGGKARSTEDRTRILSNIFAWTLKLPTSDEDLYVSLNR